jgi:hypothetical protein
MPRIIDIDTQAQAYKGRHTDFTSIVAFWKPHLIEYLKMNAAQQEAWRASDPFLNDILLFIEKFNAFEADQL